MRKLGVLIGVLVAFTSLGQPTKELEFNEITHDYGTIKEEAGPAEYKFEFKNTGQNPVKITNVRSSCGCTTPSWTREPVLPGKSGFITAVYNPRNRPGPFHKTLTVSTDGKQKTVILRVKGTVEPKPRTIEDDFPTVVGGLRVRYRAFNMGKVLNNKTATKSFNVYNQLETPITYTANVEAPDYIKVSFEPQTLGPRQKGKIIVNYDATMRDDLGFMTDNIVFFTDEQGSNNRKNFTVYADVNEYFPPLTPEEAAVAPKLTIVNRMFDFGTIEQGSTVTATYKLKNTGKNDLNIRKTHASCGCTIPKLPKDVLKAGEEVEMQVVFNTVGRRGNQMKSITIYSNDPKTPVQRVTLKASIKVGQR
ncbi:MAG: DUF1573 domain-containing protein [Bacteroidota bacterium]